MGTFAGEAEIRRLLAEVCALDPSSLRADAPLIEYGLDSARAIDLLVSLEETFGVEIPDLAARDMRTLDDIVRYVKARVEEKP
jgi:acyl carrier protein